MSSSSPACGTSLGITGPRNGGNKIHFTETLGILFPTQALQGPPGLILYLEKGTRRAQQWCNQGAGAFNSLGFCQGISRRTGVLCLIMLEGMFSDIMIDCRVRFARLLPTAPCQNAGRAWASGLSYVLPLIVFFLDL